MASTAAAAESISKLHQRTKRVTLEQLVQEVHDHEAREKHEQFMQRSAQIYAGVSSSSSTSKSSSNAAANQAVVEAVRERRSKQSHLVQAMAAA